jgi:hypothetical protein
LAITEQDQRQVLGAAKALFQQKKVVNLDDLTDYIRSVIHLQLEPADVEEAVSRLFERQGGNLPAIELHQCMIFRRSALAYWMAQYAILVMEEIYRSEPAEGETEIRGDIYLFFGIAGDDPQMGKFLGAARSTKDVLEFLKSQGIEVQGWHPLDPDQWKSLVPHTAEKIQELVKDFGKSLFAKNRSVLYAL